MVTAPNVVRMMTVLAAKNADQQMGQLIVIAQQKNQRIAMDSAKNAAATMIVLETRHAQTEHALVRREKRSVATLAFPRAPATSKHAIRRAPAERSALAVSASVQQA